MVFYFYNLTFYLIFQLTHSLEETNRNKGDASLKLEEAESSRTQLKHTNEELTSQMSEKTQLVETLNNEIVSLTNNLKLKDEALQTKEAELQVGSSNISDIK